MNLLRRAKMLTMPKSYKTGKANPLMLWVNLDDPIRPFGLRLLIILTQAILDDVIKRRKKFRETNVPAVTTTVQRKYAQESILPKIRSEKFNMK